MIRQSFALLNIPKRAFCNANKVRSGKTANVDVKVVQLNQKRDTVKAKLALKADFSEEDDIDQHQSVILLRKYGLQGDWRRCLGIFRQMQIRITNLPPHSESSVA